MQLMMGWGPAEEREGLEKQEAYPHDHLKVVEIVGFHGYPIDLARDCSFSNRECCFSREDKF